jgi:hypothetical protein
VAADAGVRAYSAEYTRTGGRRSYQPILPMNARTPMPASVHYGLPLNSARRPRTMPQMRWTREIPHHAAIRWTR